MQLAQATRSAERGFAMAGLLVSIALISLALSVAISITLAASRGLVAPSEGTGVASDQGWTTASAMRKSDGLSARRATSWPT